MHFLLKLQKSLYPAFNIQIDLLILKTYDGQLTLTTKKSLHIIFKTRRTHRALKRLFLVTASSNLVVYDDDDDDDESTDSNHWPGFISSLLNSACKRLSDLCTAAMRPFIKLL